MKNNLKQMKGITLIALVITIIVLLILAGISIATLTGQNGILTQAMNAKEGTEENTDLEEVKLAITTGISDNMVYNTDVNDAIQKELMKTDENATVTGEGQQKEIFYNNKIYTVDLQVGKVEQISEEELAKRDMKIKINTGEDGEVILPISETGQC